jgi:hypothetical protein
MEDSTKTQNETHGALTVGETVDAYMVLNDLDPSALGRTLTDQVVESADALEPVVQTYRKKLRKHRQRLATKETEDGLELDEEAKAELEDVREDLRGQEAGIDSVPRLDVEAAPSIRALRAVRSIEELEPLIPSE